MKQIFSIIILLGIINGYSQETKSTQPVKMNTEILKKIELDSFTNRTGLEMGLAIVNLAKERKQNIAVQVERLNHVIFLYVDDNLPEDKHNWLRRKLML